MVNVVGGAAVGGAGSVCCKLIVGSADIHGGTSYHTSVSSRIEVIIYTVYNDPSGLAMSGLIEVVVLAVYHRNSGGHAAAARIHVILVGSVAEPA